MKRDLFSFFFSFVKSYWAREILGRHAEFTRGKRGNSLKIVAPFILSKHLESQKCLPGYDKLVALPRNKYWAMGKLAGITPFTMGKLLEALQIITRFWVKWWALPENKYQFMSKVAGAPDYSG